MNPGESRRFSNKYEVVPANYAKGVTYPQASSIAAIYADGTTFGDPNVLAAMIERRRNMLTALTDIGTAICSAGQQGASAGDIESALSKQQAEKDAQSPAGKAGRAAAYSLMMKSLGARGVAKKQGGQKSF